MKNYFTLVPALLLAGLVGCGSDSESTDSTPTEKQQAPKSETKNKYVSPLPDTAPVYKVAIEKDDYPPFEFKDEYGVYMGYDLDLIRKIGEEVGFKVEINPLPFAEVLPSLDSGDSDIAASAMTASKERKSKFLASNPYIITSNTYAVTTESGIISEGQLEEKNIAVQEASYQFRELKDTGITTTILPKKTTFLGFQAILTGDADALYANKTMLSFFSEQFPETSIEFISQSESVNLAIFTKTDNEALMAKINDGLAKMQADGSYEKLNEKWFGKHAQSVAVK